MNKTPPPPLSQTASDLLKQYRDDTPNPPAPLSDPAQMLLEHYHDQAAMPLDAQTRVQDRLGSGVSDRATGWSRYGSRIAVAAITLVATGFGIQLATNGELANFSPSNAFNSAANFDADNQVMGEGIARNRIERSSPTRSPNGGLNPNADDPTSIENGIESGGSISDLTTVVPNVRQGLADQPTSKIESTSATLTTTVAAAAQSQRHKTTEKVHSLANRRRTKKHPKASSTTSPQPSPHLSAIPSGPPRSDTLADETQLLKLAQSAIANKQFSRAKSTLREYARAFPKGLLQPERKALDAVVACQTGSRSKIKAVAFFNEYPSSPLAPQVRRACSADSK